MKPCYRQRHHSFGLHAQVTFTASLEATEDLLTWCMDHLQPGTWDYQRWPMGTTYHIQVDTVDPENAMLMKLTWG